MKVVAMLCLVLGILAAVIGTFVMFSEPSHGDGNAAVVGGALMVILLSGGVYLLADIATMMEDREKRDTGTRL